MYRMKGIIYNIDKGREKGGKSSFSSANFTVLQSVNSEKGINVLRLQSNVSIPGGKLPPPK